MVKDRLEGQVMPEETNVAEQQQDKKGKEFWRQFWAAILITIIPLQWALMLSLHVDKEKVRFEVLQATARQNGVQAENRELTQEISLMRLRDAALREEIEGVRRELSVLRDEDAKLVEKIKWLRKRLAQRE